MKILFVTDTYYPRINGVAKSIQSFADELTRQGNVVTIVAPDYGKTVPRATKNYVKIVLVPSKPVKFSPEDRLPIINGETRQTVKNLLDEWKPDIVHTHTPFSLGWYVALEARKRHIELVHTYHTHFEAYLPLYFKWIPKVTHRFISKHFSRIFCNLHDKIIAPSSAMVKVLSGYGITAKTYVLPTGIDIKPFNKGTRELGRKALGVTDDTKILLTVGRVALEKNIPFLLTILTDVLAKGIKAKLVIAGQGPALQYIKDLVYELELDEDVIWIGLLPLDKLADLYAAADAFVISSKTETQGLVLVEAMAAGTHCIAMDLMGIHDFNISLRGVTLCPEDDEEYFLNAVLLHTRCSERSRKLFSQDAKLAAEEWTVEKMGKRLEEVYNYFTHKNAGG